MFHAEVSFDARLKEGARELKMNMTDAEKRLWQAIERKRIGGY